MRAAIAAFLLVCLVPLEAHAVRLKELVDVEGFRENDLVGFGLVVGLAGTGDDATSAATRRPLAAMMKHLGLNIDPSEIKAKNVAVVSVTAKLPPFARPGMKIDVTVSSLGTAKSLQGGTLLGTPLKGADLGTYAIAQGPLSLGGFVAGGASGSTTTKNHNTVGLIPGGATVERDAPGAVPRKEIVLLLRRPDFTTATRVAAAIGKSLGDDTAKVRDPAAVIVSVGGEWQGKSVELIAKLEALDAVPDAPARVVIDERTGTVVVGAAVTIGPAAIAHGDLTINVSEQPVAAQPAPLSPGKTTVVPSTQVEVHEPVAELKVIKGAATVGDVAAALNALGVKPRDLVPIFQALRAAGALNAEIQVL